MLLLFLQKCDKDAFIRVTNTINDDLLYYGSVDGLICSNEYKYCKIVLITVYSDEFIVEVEVVR